MQSGEIWRYSGFYVDADGELADKYLVVLAVPGDGSDIVVRLLTSRSHGRPEDPPCYHGLPYGGYFLGLPRPILTERTWVDLRYLDDLDFNDFERRSTTGTLVLVGTVSEDVRRNVILCVAAADDTTAHQERRLRDALAPTG